MNRRTLLGAIGGAFTLLAGCSERTAPDQRSTTTRNRETPPSTQSTETTTETTSETTSAGSGTAADPEISNETEAAADLELGELASVSGTMVNLGATGTATNASSSGRWLTDCELVVTGKVGDQTFTATAARNWLAPRADWTWKIPFGEAADAADSDSVELLSVEKYASYWK